MDEKLSESEMAYDLITTGAEHYPTSERKKWRESKRERLREGEGMCARRCSDVL